MAGIEKDMEDYFEKLSESEKRAMKFNSCGCCPVGLVLYPNSIKEVLGTDCHSEFVDNFRKFLRKKKDKNTSSNWHYELKHEQRFGFAILTERLDRKDDLFSRMVISEVGRRFLSLSGRCPDPHSEWVSDLLTGFDRAEALIEHFKEVRLDDKAVNKDLVVAAHRWVVEQLDIDLNEYIEFRVGLDEEERGNWDKMVKKEIKERRKAEGCDDSSEEEDVNKEG